MKYGGPAFPVPLAKGWDGMTLRDYFAGQFVIGYLAQDDHGSLGTVERQSGLAMMAYDFADAMLKERERAT